MRLLTKYFSEFANKLEEIDNLYQENKMIDEKHISSSVYPYPLRIVLRLV